MKRRNSGATLAFVAGSIIFIVIVALAFYFLSQLLGGTRELQAAVNSGSLNVAKNAALQPSVKLPSGSQDIADMSQILNGVLPTQELNLLQFNRMAGQAMLVAMNAEADGNTAALGNARTFIDLVEGNNGGGSGAASAAQSLTSKLKNGSAWAKKYFEDTAGGNSLRMLNNNEAPQWQSGDFNVGYYGAGQPTNLTMNNFLADGVDHTPYSNVSAAVQSSTAVTYNRASVDKSAFKKDSATGDTYLVGYQGVSFGSVNRTLYGIPFDTQPHLVSVKDFSSGAAQTQPGLGNNVVLPPNAFLNGAISRDTRKTNKDVHMLAAAMVGYNRAPESVSMPYGYIVLDNHLSKNWSGLIPNPDTVFVKELGAPGITVDSKSGFFERGDENQIENWQQTPRDKVAEGKPYAGQDFNPERDGPAWDKIFNKSGDAPASKTDVANNIPYGGTNVTCNHSNSDGDSPGANPSCTDGTAPTGPNGICPFDKAFHPDRTNANTSDPLNLTATEQTGCSVIDLWQKATAGQPYAYPVGKSAWTGIGLYPQNHNPIKGESAPWSNKSNPSDFGQDSTGDAYSDPKVPCKVTTPGNFAQLTDQTVGIDPDYTDKAPPKSQQGQRIADLIKQRMHEILPADNATIDAAYTAHALKPLKLGDTLYIYLNPADNFKSFTSDTSPPAWLNSGSLMTHVFKNPEVGISSGSDGLDGKAIQAKDQKYGVAMTMGDAKHQWGIHDTPFIHVNGIEVTVDPHNNDPAGNGSIEAHDYVYVNANSGAFGNLLNVTFQERTQTTGGGAPPSFTDRD